MWAPCGQKAPLDVTLDHVLQSVNSRATPTNTTNSEDWLVALVGPHRGWCGRPT
jgi:hypothetical protein